MLRRRVKHRKARSKPLSGRQLVAASLLALCLGFGGAVMSLRRTPHFSGAGYAGPQPDATSGGLSPSTPLKEYVYADSRLIAMDEPGANSLAAPAAVEAVGGSGAQVFIAWSAVWGADHYQVERAAAAGEFTQVVGNVYPASFTDTVAPGKAYLYRVRAVDAAGNTSQPSKEDLATAIAFTDEPLARQTATTTGTRIKVEHLTQLRQGVQAVRDLVGGLPPASWTHPDPVSTPAQRRPVYLVDVTELRARLDEALSRLNIQRPYVTDPNLSGGPIKAAHFQELRDRLR